MKAFLDRPIEGDWPYLWIDATYLKVRQNGRIVSVAVIVAVGVNTDGRREVLGMDIGPSEAETFWTGFLRKLARRGLRGVKLVAVLTLMRRFDEMYLNYPVAGQRMLQHLLKAEGFEIERQHVGTLMRKMGIEALYRRPIT